MSDPVSNSEIEDVLASIRRLVSENAKALKGDRTRDPEAEKLVLTPALRIDESEAQAAPTDVFAVDTDTWNDVSRDQKPVENTGFFSHREQRPSVVVDRAEATGPVAVEPVVSAPEAGTDESTVAAETAETDAAESLVEAVAEDLDLTADEGETDANSPVGSESVDEVSPAKSALEQRIAELETAMHLRPAPEKAVAAELSETVSEPVAEAKTAVEDLVIEPPEPEGVAVTPQDIADEPPAEIDAPAAAAAPAPEPAAKPAAAEAPPKSWIEGLVAAAAAAEATRIAARAKAREAEVVRDEPAPEREDKLGAAAETEVAAEETAEAGDVAETAETVKSTADEGPLTLTKAQAVPSEPVAELADVDAENEADAETLGADTTPEEADAKPGVEALEAEHDDEDAGTDAAEAEAEDADEVVDVTEEAEELGVLETAEDDADEEVADTEEPVADVAAAPERSWVDRLIAAAATLRNAPGEAAAEEDAGEASEVEVETVAEDEAVVAEDAEAAEEAADDAEIDTTGPLTLEPLNLVDPILPAAEVKQEALDAAEATVPEWEAVEPPELDEAEEEPAVDVDTVLSGPWTAPVAEADAVGEAEPETAEESAVVVKGGQDVPVGALEWEPVEAAEEAEETAEAEEADTADVDEAEAEAEELVADELAEDLDLAAEDLETQEESEAEPDVSEDAMDEVDLEEVAVLAEDLPEVDEDEDDEADAPEDADRFDEIDADAAAVAAAEEAGIDWEGAGMAAAGVAAASTLYDGRDSDEEPAATAGELAERSPSVGMVEEIIVDEAMLREMVAQLVRDELQGTVGERITHNVRRLIRREIARALTLQDFEK